MSTAFQELWSLMTTREFWADYLETIRGWALGLAIATALAVPTGIVLGSSDFLGSAFRVPIEFLRPIPSAALIPVLFLSLGTGLKSEVFLAAFGAFWPLLVQTIYGVRDVDPVTTDTGRSFGLGRHERLYRITLPSAVPYIWTGLRIASTGADPRLHGGALHGHGRPRVEDERRRLVRSHQPGLRARARDRLSRYRHSPRALRDRAPRAALASLTAEHGFVSTRTYKALKLAAEIAVPIAILGAWQLWTVQAENPNFPRLSTIMVEFQELWLFSQFGTHVVPSLMRILLGFAIAVVVGVGLDRSHVLLDAALAMRTSSMAGHAPPALLISIVLHDIGDKQKVTLIAFFCLFRSAG
jgi:ABC-type nitrate/sulfonate/bicarbonate transport system permease component